ncbi:hypothetical protein [Hymenobacter bucti]|uniref:Uncharacterized protein n=1 Tax=Hymenobacter bucti TaxID=1844114 RepID=A0ABW4QWQ2_9BACT
MQDHRAELGNLLRQFEAGLARSQAVILPSAGESEKVLLELQELIHEAEQAVAARRSDQTLLEIKQLLAEWQAQRR